MTEVRKFLGMTDGRRELGPPLLCCWQDCPKPGKNEIRVVVTEGKEADTFVYGDAAPPNTITYIFCCETHKLYFVNSHRDLGNLPPGYKTSYGLLRH